MLDALSQKSLPLRCFSDSENAFIIIASVLFIALGMVSDSENMFIIIAFVVTLGLSGSVVL